MADQTKQGKMLEYAVLNRLEHMLTSGQDILVEENAALATAKGFYDQGETSLVAKMDKAACAAARALVKLEPRLTYTEGATPLHLSLQKDARGIEGDVRDILCVRKQNQWEIGISCKHNHTAVKHPRLSKTIDFGQTWFGNPCSQEYFSDVKPIFDELENLRNEGKLFRELANKEERFYVPILDAFVKEIKRLDSAYPKTIPKAMLKYLIGRQDFYKVIAQDSKKTTKIEAYNLFGTLNAQAGKQKAETKIPQLRLPEKIYDISYKNGSKNTVIITCDNGWSVSFRIHNASSRVENSLKFDIKLIGIPHELHTQTEAWDR